MPPTIRRHDTTPQREDHKRAAPQPGVPPSFDDLTGPDLALVVIEINTAAHTAANPSASACSLSHWPVVTTAWLSLTQQSAARQPGVASLPPPRRHDL
jgi:hypothetical protein